MAAASDTDSSSAVSYRVARDEEEFRQIVDFYFQFFAPREPVRRAMGSAADLELRGRPAALEEELMDVLRQGVTVMAVAGEGHRLVGIRVSALVDLYLENNLELADPRTLSRHPLWHSLTTLATLKAKARVLANEMKLGTKCRVFNMLALATRGGDETKGKGVASEMVKLALKVGTDAGCDVAVAAATNSGSKRALESAGMIEATVAEWGAECGAVSLPAQIDKRKFAVHFKSLK